MENKELCNCCQHLPVLHKQSDMSGYENVTGTACPALCARKGWVFSQALNCNQSETNISPHWCTQLMCVSRGGLCRPTLHDSSLYDEDLITASVTVIIYLCRYYLNCYNNLNPCNNRPINCWSANFSSLVQSLPKGEHWTPDQSSATSMFHPSSRCCSQLLIFI